MQKEWLFEPLDTLFFRDGISIDAGEGGYLESVFPPHPQTMQGVVRSAVILSHCKDPNLFGSGKCDTCGEKKCPLPDAIGSRKDDDYGKLLDIYGPYLVRGKDQRQRYYPTPLDLMREKEGTKRQFSLVPGKAVSCDLGKIRLPAKPENSDYKPFNAAGGWIREDALLRYLKDKKMPVDGDELLKETYEEEKEEKKKMFYRKEPKVGIAREYATHKVKTGMLYSIVSLRFEKDVRIGLRVGGIAKEIEPVGFATKIGGEGRICGLEVSQNEYSNSYGKMNLNDGKKIKLVLLQPADFDSGWLPPRTHPYPSQEGTCWEGSIDGINGVTFRLISACVGRQQKIGGYDMTKNTRIESAVKPMRSYVPAGSVYFFEVINSDHPLEIPVEGKIGRTTKIGLGHYLLGRW